MTSQPRRASSNATLRGTIVPPPASRKPKDVRTMRPAMAVIVPVEPSTCRPRALELRCGRGRTGRRGSDGGPSVARRRAGTRRDRRPRRGMEHGPGRGRPGGWPAHRTRVGVRAAGRRPAGARARPRREDHFADGSGRWAPARGAHEPLRRRRPSLGPHRRRRRGVRGCGDRSRAADGRPTPVEADRFSPSVPPLKLADARAFRFLAVLDWKLRTGWDATVRAFVAEIAEHEDVSLC